tara:strand:- start:383 stop:778 length:396 start_codon:yes stop_codon:yes gene_type:complete
MAYSGFKGIGPNKIGAKKGGAVSPAKQKASDMAKPMGAKDAPAKANPGKSPAKNMNKGYGPMETSAAKQTAKQKKNLPKQIVDAIAAKAKSPAKKNGMKYDIKQASNQNLSASARKNYAENAQHDSKKGYR